MDDSVIYALGIFGEVIVLIVIFYIGRLFDIDFRCRQMRRWLGKNYIVVAKVQKDRKTINPIILNQEADAVFDGNKFWASIQGKLYVTMRKESMDVNKLVSEAMQKSEPIDIETWKTWEAGTPKIFVDNDSLIPLSFNAADAQVKPDEVGAAINAHNAIEKARMLANMQSKDIWFIAIILLVLAAAGIGYFNYQTLDAMKQVQAAQGAQLDKLVPPSLNVTNGSVVINAPKVGSNGG